MNYSIVIYLIGTLLQFQAAFLLLPALIGLLYREEEGYVYLIVAAITFLAGLLFKSRKPEVQKIRTREGIVITGVGWISLSLIGAIPLFLCGHTENFTDAVFEIASGFTTTGASVLSNLESMPRCMMFWRSFTHWIGGMGVLVFLLAVLPSNADGMHIMRAESPGPNVDKLVPRVRQTAFILYAMYMILTLAEFLLLILGQMPVFDAACLTFGTAGTGGFGVRSDSVVSYNSFCQVVITIFMVLFGVNFKLYYLIFAGKLKEAFKQEEVRGYLIIYAAAVILISVDLYLQIGSVGDSIKHAAFQAASVMTTTGFATADFDKWHTLPKVIMVCLMFVGACAGSTGGGVKVSRILLYVKQVRREVLSFVHPKSVKKIRLDGKGVSEETIRTTNAYLMVYGLVAFVSLILISLDGFDFTTSFTAVLATLNNIGPGLGAVGPMGSFAGFSAFSKWVFIFDMIAGRLEIFPILILFNRLTWKK